MRIALNLYNRTAACVVPAVFGWTPDDAETVVLEFTSDVVWRVPRGLLLDGLAGLAGAVDIAVWPDGTQVVVVLSDGERAVEMAVSARALDLFLRDTVGAVPSCDDRGFTLDDWLAAELDRP